MYITIETSNIIGFGGVYSRSKLDPLLAFIRLELGIRSFSWSGVVGMQYREYHVPDPNSLKAMAR